MSKRVPQIREVMDERTVVVHRTHDRELAHGLVVDWYVGTDRRHPDLLPEWANRAEQGEVVWLRINPVAPGGDYGYMYAAAAEGKRGAFRAVVFSGEPERCHWWHGKEQCQLVSAAPA